jgi:pyruvate kinase
MPRTKIVCTLGPASEEEDTIRGMIEAGMSVARINFSHGTHADHARRIRLVRRLADEHGCYVAVLADLQGPKLRVGVLPREGVLLAEGDTIILHTYAAGSDRGVPDAGEGGARTVPLPHPEVARDVSPGERMLLDDGLLELRVLDTDGEDITTDVLVGGILSSRKGLSLPHTGLRLPSVTSKDQADIAFALDHEVDFFALSFVRRAEDIQHLRAFLAERQAEVPIIAKIEKPEAIDAFSAILSESDGIMVARGDLGIEAPAEEVPIYQKRIIRACNEASKPVITATQMLDSMMRHPRPTRAEASDVANAILDGTDALMLSGETAVGNYPLETVRTMARIARTTERNLPYADWVQRAVHYRSDTVTDAISQATCEIAAELEAQAIFTSTMSGLTAQMVARHRPLQPILAFCPLEGVCRRLALVWGVTPLRLEEFADTDAMIANATEAACQRGLVDMDDLVVITAGVPLGGTGRTNLLKVHRVGEEKGWR